MGIQGKAQGVETQNDFERKTDIVNDLHPHVQQ